MFSRFFHPAFFTHVPAERSVIEAFCEITHLKSSRILNFKLICDAINQNNTDYQKMNNYVTIQFIKHKVTAKNMQDCGFLLKCILLHKNIIVDLVHIQENTGQ